MYIESLNVKQFRCFEEATIDFQYAGRPNKNGQATPRLPNVNLLLGDNGTGKTAVLKAISLAVLAPVIQGAGFRPYYLVRRAKLPLHELDMSSSNAEIQANLLLHSQDNYPIHERWNASLIRDVSAKVTVSRLLTTEQITSVQHDPSIITDFAQGLFDENAPGFFLAGYGATRRIENSENFDSSARNKIRSLRYQRFAGLFEDYFALTPLDAWRTQMSDQNRLPEGKELLNSLLPSDIELYFRHGKEMMFNFRGTTLPYEALSDGYRTFIGLIGDLLYYMCRATPKEQALIDLRGVVMVDELDLLLHPAWQRTVVESLATTFPNLQFFFTSHSPIVAGTLEAANIFVTETDHETGAATVHPGKERIHGLSADQILTSPYFGLPTPRAPDAVNQMNDLAYAAWEGNEDASLEFLRRLTEGFEPAQVHSTTDATNFAIQDVPE